jgi:xanthine dehydrogenase accessory factor
MYVAVDGSHHGVLDSAIDEEVISLARNAMAAGRSSRYSLVSSPQELEIFVDAILPSPTLVMVGGVHIAVALTTIAKAVGYRTIVIDPRRAFGSAERFEHVDRLIQAWPTEAFKEVVFTPATAVAMLTHDPKIDDPALLTVLPSPAFYVGALGSTTTHSKRRQRLLDAGMALELVNRIHSPIGMDINASTPEEIAVAIMAEIVATRHHGGYYRHESQNRNNWRRQCNLRPKYHRHHSS